MKEIFTLITSLLVIMSCGNKLSEQDVLDNLSKKVCECIESKGYKSADKISPCYDELIENHHEIIKKIYNTSNLSKLQLNEFSNKIAAKTLENCEYIKNNFPSGIVGEKRTKQINVNCEDLKNSNLFYLTQRPNSKIVDSTFVTISHGIYLERMRNRTTYSRSEIIWKDNCKYELIFQESNDPLKKEMMKTGDVFEYEVIANEEKSFFVGINHNGRDYQYEIFKIKIMLQVN